MVKKNLALVLIMLFTVHSSYTADQNSKGIWTIAVALVVNLVLQISPVQALANSDGVCAASRGYLCDQQRCVRNNVQNSLTFRSDRNDNSSCPVDPANLYNPGNRGYVLRK